MDNPVFSKFRWYVLVTMLAATIAQGMALISPAPLVGEIANEVNKSLGEVTGALMGIFILSLVVSAVIGGIILDRIGIVKTYFIGLALLCIGSLSIPLIGGSFKMLLISRVIQGLGAGPIMGSISKLAAEWFPSKERAFVTGLQGAAVSLGIAIGFALAPVVFAKTADWRTAMAYMAAGSIAGLILNTGFAMGAKLRHTSAPEESEPDDHSNIVRQYVKKPVFWAGVISVFLLSWTMQGYNDITPGHLAVEPPVGLGLGPVTAGKFMGILQLSFVLGAVASGFILAKVFRNVHRYLLSAAFLLTGFFCIMVLSPFVYQDEQMIAVFLALSGFFMGMPIPIAMAFVSSFYPEHITGRIGGMTQGLGILGGMTGVAVGSMALHTTGFYTIPIVIVGCVCIAGAVNAFGLNPDKFSK